MIILPPVAPDIVQICRNLRPDSAAEAFASCDHDDPAMLADIVMFLARRAEFLRVLAAHEAGPPLMLLGLTRTGPGRAGMIFLVAQGAEAIAISTTRWWRKAFMPEVMAKWRRVEFTGSAPGTRSGQWLSRVGFECEGVARAYGKDGSDFGHWAWVNPSAAARPVDDGEAALRSQGLTAEGAAPHV